VHRRDHRCSLVFGEVIHTCLALCLVELLDLLNRDDLPIAAFHIFERHIGLAIKRRVPHRLLFGLKRRGMLHLTVCAIYVINEPLYLRWTQKTRRLAKVEPCP
jgi:hypothetical protein